MPSNPLLHFITKVINLEDIKFIHYHFITDDEIVIEVENKLKVGQCPHCGNTMDKIHQNHWYTVRDIPLSDYQVFLKVNRRQLRCTKCHKVFSEALDFIKTKRTYTKRLGMKVMKEVLETNVESVALRNRMTASEVETLLKEQEADLLKEKLAVLTHSKYPLLKKKESLYGEEKAKIHSLQKVTPELGEMYQNKEAIRNMFESHITSDEALYKFLEWAETAYKLFPKSCQTISRWIDKILAYFDHRTTQGLVEGINQKIKLIKRRAYGLQHISSE